MSVQTEPQMQQQQQLRASAGAVGASTTTAVAVNRSRFDAFIGQGVSIKAPSAKIDMKGYLKADAKAIIVSAAGGLAGVGVSVAVAVNPSGIHDIYRNHSEWRYH